MKKLGIIFSMLVMLLSLSSCSMIDNLFNQGNQNNNNSVTSGTNQNDNLSTATKKEFEVSIQLTSIQDSSYGTIYYFTFNFSMLKSCSSLEIETGSGSNISISGSNIYLFSGNNKITDQDRQYDFTGIKTAKLMNVSYSYKNEGEVQIRNASANVLEIQINPDYMPSDGTAKVVKISSISDFKNIKDDNRVYELQNDIDFENQSVNLEISFNGTLNGNGYKLKNISNNSSIDNTGSGFYNYSAIFETIGASGIVKDLILLNCNSSLSSTTYNNIYSSILCCTNRGIIENVEFKQSDITTNKNDSSIYQGSLVVNNYGSIKNITIDDVDVSSSSGKRTELGGLVANNNGTISNAVIYDSSASGISAGQVVYNNSGTIENVAVINCHVTSTLYQYTVDRNLGGIAAINSKIIRNSYVFDTDMQLMIKSKMFGFNSSIGGLVGVNQVGGVITKCYYMGDIIVPTKQHYLNCGITDSISPLSRDYVINVGGICGNDSDKLESNFSDCKITGFANKSLTVPTLSNPIYRDIMSVGIKKQGETRLVNDDYESGMTHDETYANIVSFSASQSQYMIEYFTNNNGSISSTSQETTWSDFLTTKKSIVSNSSNSGLVYDSNTKFYPYIKAKIGYLEDTNDYQAEVKTSDAKSA